VSTVTKLTIGGALIASVTGYMAFLGARSSWQYYLTVDECAADASELVGSRLRVNGRVAPNSLEVEPDRTGAAFVLRGSGSGLFVTCDGPLPDNLAEDIDVVVEGHLDSSGVLRGDKVLTRCASKYRTKTPPGAEATASATRSEVAR
jgi:cytochrome c-type biogenesis protein CcmE